MNKLNGTIYKCWYCNKATFPVIFGELLHQCFCFENLPKSEKVSTAVYEPYKRFGEAKRYGNRRY